MIIKEKHPKGMLYFYANNIIGRFLHNFQNVNDLKCITYEDSNVGMQF